MLGQNDWKNVEITGYVKFNSGSEDNFAWYARGGRHTGDGPMTGVRGWHTKEIYIIAVRLR